MERVPIVMTIAGSDSGGGAGIQADLKTFAALGVYGTTAITAITAQNTVGVTAVFELPPDMVAAQIDAIVEDMGADAVKTGMLASSPIIEAVADRLRHHRLSNVVVDPVMVAKSGHPLLLPEAVDALRRLLLPLATVVTPNLPEAETLVGRALKGEEEMEAAARQIADMGARAVVIKGGHLPGDEAVDLLYWQGRFYRFASPRLATVSTHGTGCTFASAIAAHLAKGLEVPEAVSRAKDYLTQALRHAYPLGHGHGPVHHFWRWWGRV
ncbi:MAG: bifunctional hydroxymethylpyrimidine kinase/phosphomethylpyrimidine kinase [Dehalococcoidia bacterium]|jgi:hydroxymethylpyrimidine/phosphomethylpyrimidine kinase|nr:bifunctional hydroxymethylpyrimidine kinase/phosphomethylpyrimidine kinase [Dehalococcoidia bacterium]MDW8009287.1 bifunctional hydroxymethylpyrimidine kinase/phosphomethylpyrimidine kinase [Chloroflexota bacterium]